MASLAASWLTVAPSPRLDGMHTPDTEQTVARCAELVAERFVHPEVGVQAAARLRERAAARAYDGLDPASLAAALSADLQDVAHDLHLRVIHHPEGVPPTEDPQAYDAYWRDLVRLLAPGERPGGGGAHPRRRQPARGGRGAPRWPWPCCEARERHPRTVGDWGTVP